MLESKTIRVNYHLGDSETRARSYFGWRLLSSQDVVSHDNHLEKRGNSVYQVKSTEKYVKLTLERDTSIEKYNELVSLESQYDALVDVQKKGIRGLDVLLILLFGLGILIIAFKVIHNVRAKNKNLENKKQREGILSKARALRS